MARGRKTPESKTEEVRAILMLNPDATGKEISKITKLPVRTAQDLKSKVIEAEPDTFASLRAQKKEEFIEEAWEVVSKALKLTNKRFTKALEDEDALEEIIETINSDGDLKAAEKQALYRRLKDLQMTNIKDIAIALGTIYDKQALASGEPTTITERPEPITKLMEEYEDKLKKLKSIIGGKTG